MADTFTLKEVELDYEAEEAEERTETPIEADDGQTAIKHVESVSEVSKDEDNECGGKKESGAGAGDDHGDSELPDSPAPFAEVVTDLISSPAQDGELGEAEEDEREGGELESGEELEDGEISDEDETLKNERLEPKPVCRFFAKGQCTWGQSCRFLHPGVLDKGNYSMFAAPRPILPGEPEDVEPLRKEKVTLVAPKVPEYESAWERGLRQAKEMRRRSTRRRETDAEYEEKKTSQSLTQAELDKENDYYARAASPAHTHDPYADDTEHYDRGDPYDTFHPEVRRIAPPPPPEFLAREERERSRYPAASPPAARPRRIAPPRSLSPRPGPPHPGPPSRFRGGEDWADPWMRAGPEKGGAGPKAGGRGRRRSYSSGSSRSSSGSSRSPRRRRRYSSSSYSSGSRSRSRSSTPAGIPRREGAGRPGGIKREPGGSSRNTAPLQKRLAGASEPQKARGQRKSKDERGTRKRKGSESSDDGLKRNDTKQGTSGSKEPKIDKGLTKTKEPFKMSIPKNQKLSLKNASSSKPSSNNAVFEKLGEEETRKNLKRKADSENAELTKQKSMELMETLKQRLKNKVEASKAAEKKSEKPASVETSEPPEKKSKTAPPAAAAAAAAVAAAAAKGGADAKNRREELLKQLKAVEDAIHRKRTKLDK